MTDSPVVPVRSRRWPRGKWMRRGVFTILVGRRLVLRVLNRTARTPQEALVHRVVLALVVRRLLARR